MEVFVHGFEVFPPTGSTELKEASSVDELLDDDVVFQLVVDELFDEGIVVFNVTVDEVDEALEEDAETSAIDDGGDEYVEDSVVK